MKYTAERIDRDTVLFRFVVPSAEFEAAAESVYRTFSEKYEVPGAPKGSRKMLEARFGKDIFTGPAADKIVSEAYRKAASEYPEEICCDPAVTAEPYRPGGDFAFSARVRLRPECKLCDIRAVRLTKEDREKVDKTVWNIPESERDSARQYLLQSVLINRIADNSAIELPQAMIAERALDMARVFEQRLEMNRESLEDYYIETGSDEKTMIEEFAADARQQLRSRLTLLAVARAEGLEATDGEYNAEIRRLSTLYLMDPEEIEKALSVREGARLREDIAVSKAAEFIGHMVRRQCRDGAQQ